MDSHSRFVLALSFITLPIGVAAAQVDTIDSSHDLLLKNLLEGRSQYMVSVVMPNGWTKYVGLWTRTVRHETAASNERLIVDQDWWTSDSSAHRKVYSICSPKDLSPIYHYSRDGKGKIEAYNFAEGRVTGSDTTADNSKKGFDLAFSAATLNWELDLEVFQTLPYALNKTFVINFYHPGGPPPDYYSYAVTGEETLSLAGGGRAACWVMMIDYGNGRGTTTFWVSKMSHEVLKSKDVFNGACRYKVKLATEVL